MSYYEHAPFDVASYITPPQLPTAPERLVVFQTEPGPVGLDHLAREANRFVDPVPIHRYLNTAYPRGIRWSDFPVIAKPYHYLLCPEQFLPPTSLPVVPLEIVKQRLDEQPAFYFWDNADNWYNQAYLSKGMASLGAANLHKLLCPEKDFFIKARDGGGFVKTNPESLLEGAAGAERLNYNYRVNFQAIGFKALKAVTGDLAGLPSSNLRIAQNRANWSAEGRSGLTHIADLQFLFALRDSYGIKKRRQYGMDWDTIYNGDEPCRYAGGFWIGSGKFPGKEMRGQFNSFVFHALVLDLVEEQEDVVRITERGLRFLDIMHRDNNDPDCLLRFSNPATGLIPGAEIPRIDDWCARFFRKMKARVNALT